jgi:hypothetical protein
MSRRWLFFTVFLLACRAVTGMLPQPEAPTAVQTPALAPQTVLTPVPVPRATPGSDPAGGYRLQVHPDGALYSGDLVSFEVVAPAGTTARDSQVRIQVDPPVGPVIGVGELAPYGIGGRVQATFLWVWETAGLSPREYALEIVVGPAGPVWRETVELLPAEERPAPETGAAWAEAQIPCCRVRYITGTAAERDLAAWLPVISNQAQDAASVLGTPITEPISIVLLPRLLGHGGFAMDEIYVSYLDRSYAVNNPDMVLRHEIIHVLDGRSGAELRPTIFAEGLAVYLTGGHFKVEPLLPRAAALVELGGYLPLEPLSDTFYLSQHEAGYLQAGALVEYMVNTWGLDAFLDFYRSIRPNRSGSHARAIDEALREHFGLSFTALEARFVAALEAHPVNPDLLEDVRLTVHLYETLRRYQRLLDPSAYFLSAWLPDIDELPQGDVVADYLRRPAGADEITLEVMLGEAGGHLQAGRYHHTGRLLAAVDAVLDRIEIGNQQPFSATGLSADYLSLVTVLQGQGYQVQEIILEGDTARVWAKSVGVEQVEITTTRVADLTWVIDSLAD